MLKPLQKHPQIPQKFLDNGTLSATDFKRVNEAAATTGQPVRRVLDRLGLVSQKDWALACSQQLGLSLAMLENMPIALASDSRLSAEYLKRSSIAPLEISENAARFAIADPFDTDSLAALEMIFGSKLVLQVATDRDIELAIARSKDAASRANGDTDQVIPDKGGLDLDTDRLTELANNAPTVRYLEALFAGAIELRATDIHLEALEAEPRVRLRVDGELVEVEAPERQLYDGVVSRLKILAGMDISERRLPQDGRIRQKAAGRDIDMRVASAPTIHGETMVLRLLDNDEGLSRLEDLNLPPHVDAKFQAALKNPNGLILVTGPTGSGKTTTLHGALNELNNARRKIVTIENPVEIQTKGLQQIEVNPELGWTFAAALRTVLRHDPDIIMVGEIRDQETAELAIRAAMTGHLVFSTLHTNRAADAVTRLVDLGVPKYLLTSVVRMVAAQRLVRKVCPSCATPLDFDADPQKKTLYEGLSKLDPDHGPLDSWTVVEAKGCENCNWSGYRGRIALFEALDGTETLKALNGESTDVKTMAMEGVRLVSEGQTTFEEITRVLGVSEFSA